MFVVDDSPLYITRVTEDKYFLLRGMLPVKDVNTESMEIHEDALEVTDISGFEIAIGQTFKFYGAYPTKVVLGKEDTPNICNNFEEMKITYNLIKDEE